MKHKSKNLCVVCYKEFYCSRSDASVCSRKCRLKRAKKISESEKVFNGLTKVTIGEISELRVCEYLLRKGYSIFRSLSPSCFCDAIAIKGNRILKIEIRTGKLNKEGKILYLKKTWGKIDLFGVFIPSNNNIEKIVFFDNKGKEIKL